MAAARLRLALGAAAALSAAAALLCAAAGAAAVPRTQAAAPWPAARCARQADAIAADVRLLLLHYGPEAAYPADLYYVLFRGVFEQFQAHRCAPRILGRTLVRRFTPAQRRELLRHLPPAQARAIRRALALAR